MKIMEHDIIDESPFSAGPAGFGENRPGEKYSPAPRPEQIEGEIVSLMNKYSTALSRYGSTATRDRTIVQDGIQEAFLRYFLTRVSGRHVENPRAWLFRVFRNYVVDCKRKRQSMPKVNLEAAGQVVDSRQNVEAGYQQNESLHRVLTSLSRRELECMQLRLEGFCYAEIAEVLGIRSGTVAALLARGLKKIRESDFFNCGR